jgi:L-2-hydroxyglutarate oxidase LhgO
MAEIIECAVIGAGVVGLAIARQLALAGREVVLLEKEAVFGSGASSRNSEVIHAGMYYPTNSLKARLCVEGNRLLKRYLEERHVAHRVLGKLIVAVDDDEVRRIETIFAQGQANGVPGLELWDGDRAAAVEPALCCVAALHSPGTGIFDSHAYMLALLGDFEAAGGIFVRNSPVVAGEIDDKGILLSIGGAEPTSARCKIVVNAAGPGGHNIARSMLGDAPPTLRCKGNYFLLTGQPPFSRLVYPVPGTASIGLHFTLDLAGQGRFGPDVEWVDDADLAVDPKREAHFYESIRTYWPAIPDGSLRPGYAGIRPKIVGPGVPPADFVIAGPETHGVAGLVNLFGIESPGLTASLAIARHVGELLQ